MKKMNKMSCGIIYAAKLNKQENIERSIAHFLSKYTDTPFEYYNTQIITRALINAISDLLNNMEYPAGFWNEYWRWKQGPWNMNDLEAMCAALNNVQVRTDSRYINGFCSIEELKECLE